MARTMIVLLLCLQATASLAVELPAYPIEANCREATTMLFEGSQLSPARKKLFEQSCISTQQGAYNSVANIWSAMQARDQQSCLHLIQTQNYILLARCASALHAQEVGVAALSRKPY